MVDDNVKVSFNLELKSMISELKQSNDSVTEYSEQGTSRAKYKLTTYAYDTKDSTNNCNKPALTINNSNTFSLGITKDSITSATSFGNEETDDALQNDYLLVNSYENNTKNEFALKDSCEQSRAIESNIQDVTPFPDHNESFQRSSTSSKIVTKDTAIVGRNYLKNYNASESVFQESKVSLQAGIATNNCYESTEDATCFSAEIQMICENQGNLLSDQTAQMVIAQGNGYCSDQIAVESSLYNELSKSPDLICLHNNQNKHESAHIQNDEFHSDQYENLEFSAIFSPDDIYQQSFDQSYAVKEISEHCPRFITDLNSQPCEKTISDSGIFGISLSDTGTTEVLQNSVHYSCEASLSDQSTVVKADLHNSIFYKPQDIYSVPSLSNALTNATMFSDSNPKLLNHLQTGHLEYHSGGNHKSSTSTVTLNLTAIPFHYSFFDKALSESSVYDPCLNDYSKNYQKSLYQISQGHSATCAEWNPWAKGNCTPHGIHSTPKHTADDKCSVSSSDIRDNAAKPEFLQFLQMEVKEDEEETDDADETEYLPMSFNTKSDNWSDHTCTGSVGTPENHGDNSSAGYGPSVLTPPPSASSTPVPSSSQDNYISEEIDFYTPWPASYDGGNTYSSSCKLKSEQLETSLLSYGLSQCTKRPFPSMADVMRKSRSKSASRKKCTIDVPDQQPRRSGRPRKIQSDKISTTAISGKQRKKSKSKCEMEMVEQNDTCLINSLEDQIETRSSRMSVAARHNEPLNQHAIEIMTQWFEEHIENPYPSKADKEKMAVQGDITENQVKSWFANKRNRTNNTKPKVQKRAMEEKLKEIFRDLKRNHHNPMADNSHVIQQLSGIIQHCHTAKLD